MVGAGLALHLADSGGGAGVGRRVAFALSPSGQLRLAGVGGGICRALLLPAAFGADATGARPQHCPCARLLVVDRCAGAGAALRLAAVVRAVQRLALVGLGDFAECVFGVDGRATQLAMAGIGVSARIPCLRGGAVGLADAGLVLVGNGVSDGTAEPLPYVPL